MAENENAQSFESKLEKTKQILEKLSNSELPLDVGVKLYKEGMKELAEATKMLEDAKLEFETIERAISDEPDA